MKEKEIADTEVLKKLIKLGFSKDSISNYDTYPIHIGKNIYRADFVCFIGMNERPYLVVEVKKSSSKYDIPQVESYALLLNAPFFCLTDGINYKFYLTGSKQNESIEINILPLPKDYSDKELSIKDKSAILEIKKVTNWVYNKNQDYWFLKKFQSHMNGLEYIKENFNMLDRMSEDELKEFLTSKHLMNHGSNNNYIRAAIENDKDLIIQSLKHLLDKKISLEERYDDLYRRNSKYKIPGIGALVITRMLAAINNEYFSIDDQVLDKLSDLKIISKRDRSLTGREYRKLIESFFPLHKEEFFKEYSMEFVHYVLWTWNIIWKEFKG